MAEVKTKENDASVTDFLNSVEDTQRREDSFAVLKMMQAITRCEPRMWGPSIIGFGNYHYKYKSGREGDWFLTGYSPRKQSLSLYIMSGFKRYPELLEKLGRYKTGKACLYIKRLDDIDLKVLKELIRESVKYMKTTYK